LYFRFFSFLFSLGIQSLDDEVLRNLTRQHTAQQALDLLEEASTEFGKNR
jgi:coproporphyrinogen III oxidase-like Fe-S oxidoreductase